MDLATAGERAGERATLVALDSAQARTLQECAWKAVEEARLEFHSRDVLDLEVELEGLKVAGRRLSFTLRSVLFELDVEFEAVLGPDGTLTGLARTASSTPDRPLLLGHWSAAREGG